MKFNYEKQDYSSNRNVVFSKNGMVSTTQPLASQAGLDILKKGGNAIDAAIAAATTLAVTEPTSNGIGGDTFAIIWFEGKLYGLNGSGPAAKNISIEKVKAQGFDKIPDYGMLPINIPGAPKAWKSLAEKFGKLKLKESMEPAINFAKEGYPVTPTVSKNWKIALERLKNDIDGEEFEEFFKIFTIDGEAPEPGDIWKSEEMSKTLELIAETNGDYFYKGEVAEKIENLSKKYNGFISKEDLINYDVDWVEPISVNYKGYDIWELPPNTHGIVVLMALKIFEKYNGDKLNTEYYHHMIESMKLAYSDGLNYITDYNYLHDNFFDLISEDYSKKRYDLIEENAIEPSCGALDNGGTVYLSTSDSDGNMVSLIQSNFMDFGSAVVVPGTAINLHNRGLTFSLNEEDYNSLEGGKKTYHTIIPGFITKDNKPVGPIGVMGKYMQPQGHFQVVSNLIDNNLDPQQSLDKYRWQWIEGKTVWVEKDFPKDIVEELIEKGHDIKVLEDSGSFGRGQIIIKENDIYIGGTEKRADGHISPF